MTSPRDLTIKNIEGPGIEECSYILGTYMSAWGSIEIAMALLIRKLLDTDPTTASIVIRGLSTMRAQIDLAEQLGHHRLKGSDLDTLKTNMVAVTKGNTTRNRLVHGIWRLMITVNSENTKKMTKPVAESAKWARTYDPTSREETERLWKGNDQKMQSKYIFYPERINEEAAKAKSLAKDVQTFTESLSLLPPTIPQPLDL